MKITDEMVDVFYASDTEDKETIRDNIAKLAHFIRAEALEEAARVADAVAAALPPRACRSTCCYLS